MKAKSSRGCHTELKKKNLFHDFLFCFYEGSRLPPPHPKMVGFISRIYHRAVVLTYISDVDLMNWRVDGISICIDRKSLSDICVKQKIESDL